MRRNRQHKVARTVLALAAGLMWVGAVHGIEVTYTFNYPAIAGPGVAHPAVASLLIKDLAADTVEFTLTPNWALLGTGTRFDELDLAYAGPASLTLSSSAPAIKDWTPTDAAAHAGYKADANWLMIHWFNPNQGEQFDYDKTGSWTFTGSGLSVASFTSSVAWADTKISPISGVLSLQGFPGDSQNWVTAVPEPSAYALLLAGLGVVSLVARRRLRH